MQEDKEFYELTDNGLTGIGMKNLLRLSIVLATWLASVAAQAATVNVGDSARNNITSRAFNLNSYFDLSPNANIFRSTTNLHATANVTTTNGSSYDWFSFNTTEAFTKVYLDVDNSQGGLDTWLTLENATGGVLMSNNNYTSLDPGSSTLKDSFLKIVLAEVGLYKVRVSRVTSTGSLAGLTSGHNYQLHVSMQSPVPVPAAVWLFGSAFLGLMGLRKNKPEVFAA